MIEFYGDLSDKNKRILLKFNMLTNMVAGLSTCIIFTAITIIIAAVSNYWIIAWLILLYIAVTILAICSPYFQKEKTVQLIMPEKISISDETIYYSINNRLITKPISYVKKVIDYGDHYLIKFSFPKLDGYLCQKNLLKSGSLTEFEDLFSDRLVKQSLIFQTLIFYILFKICGGVIPPPPPTCFILHYGVI